MLLPDCLVEIESILCRIEGKRKRKVGRVVLLSGECCLLKWGELTSKSGTICLGESCLGGELSLGHVVMIPNRCGLFSVHGVSLLVKKKKKKKKKIFKRICTEISIGIIY